MSMDFSKIKAERASSDEKNENQPVEAVIKVSKASYVPKKIKIRKRIDEFMFTAETTDTILKEIESDENVVSVQASEKIRVMQPKSKKGKHEEGKEATNEVAPVDHSKSDLSSKTSSSQEILTEGSE